MKNRFDLLLAGIILAISLGIAGFSYATVKGIEQTSFSISSLASGRSEYLISSKGICSGKASLEVFDDKALALELLATINATYLRQPLETQLTIQSVFNPLGQMQTTSVKLTGKDFQISMDTTGVNPAQAVIKAQIAKNQYHYNLSIPGPFLLVKQGRGYHLDYPRLASIKRKYFNAMTNPLLKSLALEILNTQDQKCVTNAAQGIELDQFISSLSSFEFLAKQLGTGA